MGCTLLVVEEYGEKCIGQAYRFLRRIDPEGLAWSPSLSIGRRLLSPLYSRHGVVF